MSAALVPGMRAPEFEGFAVGGRFGLEGATVRSGDLRGRAVVLVFYPKDGTPGCTKQACSLRDEWVTLRETGAEVFGVSVDSVESHRRFIEEQRLPYPLISDEGRRIVGGPSESGLKRPCMAGSSWEPSGRPS